MFNFVGNITIGNIKCIMKKLFLVLVILSFVENTMAQLKMALFPEKEKKEIIITYDSLTNVRYNNPDEYENRFKHLAGQKITSISSAVFWGAMDIDNGNSFSTMTFAENMDGKTFRIDSVSRYTFYMTSEDNPDNHFSLWIDADDAHRLDLAWVCHGYFEKMKKLFLGKDLVYVHQDHDYDLSEHPLNLYRFMDYNTKRNLAKRIPCNSVWRCTDVLVIPDKINSLFNVPAYSNRVILNIENEQYGKYYIFASEFLERKGNSNPYIEEYFMTMEDFHKYQAVQNQLREAAKAKAAKAAAESEKRAKEHREYIIAKYGETYGSLILQGRVVIGMTKDQCIEALGHPSRINRTTTALTIYEQWVYGNRYLYFENSKLVTIQD